MSEKENDPNNNITAKLPLVISYEALEGVLKNKLIGEHIEKDKDNGKTIKYAEILDVSLSKSKALNFDIEISFKLKSLMFLFKNSTFGLQVDVSLRLDEKRQFIKVDNFEIDSKGLNKVTDSILESVVNRFMYKKLKNKLQLDLVPKLEKQLKSINDELANRLQAKDGVHISGKMENLRLLDLKAKENFLWILISLNGWGVIEIDSIT